MKKNHEEREIIFMVITQTQIENFTNWLRLQEKAETTVQKYRRDAEKFYVFSAGREVTRELTIAYKSYLITAYRTASVNSMLIALNRFLGFLRCEECCVQPMKVQRETYRCAGAELTQEEYRRLVRAAEFGGNRRLSLLLQTVCSTGIRISELPYITVQGVKNGVICVHGKGKSRMIFLPEKLQEKLCHYCGENQRQSGPVFCTRTGSAMDRSNIWKEMKDLCALAGVAPQKVYPHNLRHLFACVFYEQEKDIDKLADLLGHSSINTTRIYLATSGDQHRRCLEQMHLVL